ncbi:ribosome biogenesis regulatory protein homolog [Amphibalanus amphitrite]|uniref:ribosome biogenesis regulatory protein homolog n=1 Tax=Amphibalanus amphitrite TaxID=1232801 RepID=UPI001C926E7F|nr:ribosome biogenesis regulatory protein homolog [Amphibalanus amphitrite]XP_043243924.1 ribosome biogenesis regulatory protein homolog [Amphibalanus amphitrite]
MDRALAVLSQIEEDAKKVKPTDVEKEVDLEYDIGLLLASDPNPLDHDALHADRDGYLQQLARDNCQLLFNRLYQLPTQTKDDVTTVNLPAAQLRMPREKPAPKPKPLTKWEEYAKAKGISRNKKGKKIWDTELKRWVPRYGAKKAQADREKNWVMEVPANVDPNTDMFAKAAEKKRERVAKNELQRLRNVKRNMKVPTVGVTPKDVTKSSTSELTEAAALARRSTASLGKFNQRLPRDAPTKERGKRRQFAPAVGDTRGEVRGQLELLQNLGRKEKGAVVDTEKAANRLIHQEQRERAASKEDKPKKGGKKRWIPNTKKGEKQKKAIAKKAGKGRKGAKGR